jgi:hypothetical protein
MDGSGLRDEGGNEKSIWSRDASGPGGHNGNNIDGPPDEQGNLTIGDVEVQANIDPERRYFAYAYIRSLSNADGDHLLYASNSLVLFDATVDLFWIRQDEL